MRFSWSTFSIRAQARKGCRRCTSSTSPARTVLVVGGSSGIGNGIAQAFRAKGCRRARVGHARERRPTIRQQKAPISPGSTMRRSTLPISQAIERWQPSFARLDVLVLSQGTVIYRRGEFTVGGFRKVVDVNLNSLMACAGKFHPMLAAAKGSLIVISSTAAYHSTRRQSGLQRLEDRRGRSDAHPRRGMGGRRHPRQRYRARPRRHQAHQGDDTEPRAPGARRRLHPTWSPRHA